MTVLSILVRGGVFQEGKVRAELLLVSGVGPNILDNYQTSVSDGAWHHLHLTLRDRRLGLVLDNTTKTALLGNPIRTGGSSDILNYEYNDND